MRLAVVQAKDFNNVYQHEQLFNQIRSEPQSFHRVAPGTRAQSICRRHLRSPCLPYSANANLLHLSPAFDTCGAYFQVKSFRTCNFLFKAKRTPTMRSLASPFLDYMAPDRKSTRVLQFIFNRENVLVRALQNSTSKSPNYVEFHLRGGKGYENKKTAR